VKATGKGTRKIGIESYDRFPAPIYLELSEALPRVKLERSTIVEELRMVKSALEVETLRKAALVGDVAHRAVIEFLSSGFGKTELDLIRVAEQAMRNEDPIYEDSCNAGPNLVCSGFPLSGSLLHLPDHAKRIERGNVVHWDLVMRYEGYSIDTSRTRVMGKATDEQKRAYEASLRMHEAVIKAAKPGVPASELVILADKVARKSGYELWDRFLGHGTGLDGHERPDLVVEDTPLAANMTLAIEPRIAMDDLYLFGNEDVVLITESGGVPLNQFPKQPLELDL
jgi:Xaa-Pro aminopeptidase